jgi:transcription antitermination factor NusG
MIAENEIANRARTFIFSDIRTHKIVHFVSSPFAEFEGTVSSLQHIG